MTIIELMHALKSWTDQDNGLTVEDRAGPRALAEHDEARADLNADLASAVREFFSDDRTVDTKPVLDGLIQEYGDLRTDMTEESIVRALVADHEWKDETARTLYALVTDYGYFMLRNAAALAIALDVADGELDY